MSLLGYCSFFEATFLIYSSKEIISKFVPLAANADFCGQFLVILMTLVNCVVFFFLGRYYVQILSQVGGVKRLFIARCLALFVGIHTFALVALLYPNLQNPEFVAVFISNPAFLIGEVFALVALRKPKLIPQSL
jgi:hypothetical protein